MTDAILFDLMGTLATGAPLAEYRLMVDRIAAGLNLPREEFFEKWMSVNNNRLLGTFQSSEGDIQHVASCFGVDVTVHEMTASMRSRRAATLEWLTPKPRAIETLRHLAELNYKLALITDCTFDVVAMWNRSPMSKLIKTTVFSCNEGYRKPDQRMYLRALTELGVSPSAAIFVGDGGSNELTGAVNVGIPAILLDDQPPGGQEVLRVGLQDWDGPRVTDISEVVALAIQGLQLDSH